MQKIVYVHTVIDLSNIDPSDLMDGDHLDKIPRDIFISSPKKQSLKASPPSNVVDDSVDSSKATESIEHSPDQSKGHEDTLFEDQGYHKSAYSLCTLPQHRQVLISVYFIVIRVLSSGGGSFSLICTSVIVLHLLYISAQASPSPKLSPYTVQHEIFNGRKINPRKFRYSSIEGGVVYDQGEV